MAKSNDNTAQPCASYRRPLTIHSYAGLFGLLTGQDAEKSIPLYAGRYDIETMLAMQRFVDWEIEKLAEGVDAATTVWLNAEEAWYSQEIDLTPGQEPEPFEQVATRELVYFIRRTMVQIRDFYDFSQALEANCREFDGMRSMARKLQEDF